MNTPESSPMEAPPTAPQLDNRRKWLLFAVGFLGWYLVNGLIWLILLRASGSNGFENLLICPANGILLVILGINRPTRFVALGILVALAANFVISIIAGLVFNAQCFIPFFIRFP